MGKLNIAELAAEFMVVLTMEPARGAKLSQGVQQ